MTTSIAIYTQEKTFISTFPENMPLDVGMFLDGDKYRYSIGTVDTSDIRAKMLFSQMIENLKKQIGSKRTVQKVLLSNNDCFVEMPNALIDVSTKLGETFIEATSSSAKGSVRNWQYTVS
jgi:hypothetical protein